MDQLTEEGRRCFVATVVGCSIATVSVALRFVSERMVGKGIHLDDYLIAFALMCYLAASGSVFWGLFAGGGGKEMVDFLKDHSPESQKQMIITLKSVFIRFNIYLPAIEAIKLSILFFYRRIFSTQNYQRASAALIIISLAWWLTVQVRSLWVCRPMHLFWAPGGVVSGNCSKFNLHFFLAGLFETLIDVGILVLPIRSILRTQLPTRTRITLACIFALGGFVIITNILRLAWAFNPHNNAMFFGRVQFWADIHLSTTFLCACIPLYRPLARRCLRVGDLLSSHFRSKSAAYRSQSRSRSQPMGIGLGDVPGMGAKERGPYSPLRGASEGRLREGSGGSGSGSVTLAGEEVDGIEITREREGDKEWAGRYV
ncbi:hypothetical protein M501DRAFT_1059930 [Patellaria atrata CBS 101060]|uniref:Rhodopsin domain-containing protein n=1 Tax=Patellaria atrata CBS 101060 TaxID=1346257 RepID=A0A9P4S5J2_9PEZI|nr:hypothetical protein M501DRAFT_1059930 [Patellaria atrata CBS 101060]